jgi:hypothetical protein
MMPKNITCILCRSKLFPVNLSCKSCCNLYVLLSIQEKVKFKELIADRDPNNKGLIVRPR